MIQRKRTLAAALVATLGLTAAACGSDDTDSPEETTADAEGTTAADTTAEDTTAEGTTPEGTTADGTTAEGTTPDGTAADGEQIDGSGTAIGLLFDITGRGDKSFNDAAAAGLDQAEADFGIDAAESAPSADDDRAPRLQLFVDEGKDLVIGVGFLWADAIAAGAANAPDTNFAIVDSVVETYNNNTPDDTSDDVTLDNVSSLVFAEHEGSFLVGAAAALTSESDTIGYVGGVETELIQRFEAGYVAGAKHINPDIEVLSEYVSQPPDFTGFTDTAKGKEIASQMYDAGADVVYHAAGQTGNGVFEAASEAGEPGEVWAIGVDSDQYLTASETTQPYILTSMLKKVDVAVYEAIKAQAAGEFAGGTQTFDLASDGVGYATSGDFLAEDVIAQLEELKTQIIDGEIEVPAVPEG